MSKKEMCEKQKYKKETEQKERKKEIERTK